MFTSCACVDAAPRKGCAGGVCSGSEPVAVCKCARERGSSGTSRRKGWSPGRAFGRLKVSRGQQETRVSAAWPMRSTREIENLKNGSNNNSVTYILRQFVAPVVSPTGQTQNEVCYRREFLRVPCRINNNILLAFWSSRLAVWSLKITSDRRVGFAAFTVRISTRKKKTKKNWPYSDRFVRTKSSLQRTRQVHTFSINWFFHPIMFMKSHNIFSV